MKKIIGFILLFCFTAICFVKADPLYNIKDYGAIADGKTLNSKAIQKAIDACAKAGGGNVIIPNGTFLTGTIKLKNNVALYLEPSAVLLGSSNYDDYEWEEYDVSDNAKRRALISGRNLQNVAILGRGTIDGNGSHQNFQSKNKKGGIGGGVRPFPISISQSSKVKIKDITVKDGAFWNMKIDGCDDVLVDGITVNSRVVANNDGIDIVDCSNVRIANCNVNVGDDGICLKSNTKRGVQNVTITNCTVKSESNGIKLGAVTVGGFENISISNCAIYDTRLSGIALEMVDGGTLDRVSITNITMHDVNGSIFMKADTRKKATNPSVFRNVIVSNIIADGIGNWRPNTKDSYYKKENDTKVGVVIAGNAECIIENVSMDNIHLQFVGGGSEENAKSTLIDKSAHGYPEYDNFGNTPAYGINCIYAKGIRFSNIVLSYQKDDVRPAMYLQNCEDVSISSLHAKVSGKAPAYIRFNNQNSALINNSKPRSGQVPFCSFEGKTKDITIMNNDISNIKETFIKTNGVDEKQIKVM